MVMAKILGLPEQDHALFASSARRIMAGLEGVEFVVANTDAQQLQFAKTERRVQLGG